MADTEELSGFVIENRYPNIDDISALRIVGDVLTDGLKYRIERLEDGKLLTHYKLSKRLNDPDIRLHRYDVGDMFMFLVYFHIETGGIYASPRKEFD